MTFILWLILYTVQGQVIHHPIAEYPNRKECKEAKEYIEVKMNEAYPDERGQWELKCEPLDKPA